jgi:hypothetical protein
MTNWSIGENESPKSYLEKPEVVEGDTIEVVSSNQLGYKKYKVILENGKKTLKILADWGAGIYEDSSDGEEDDDDDDTVIGDNETSNNAAADTQKINGGRKSRKNRKSRKSKKSKKSRKVRKSRRDRKSRSSRKIRKYMR